MAQLDRSIFGFLAAAGLGMASACLDATVPAADQVDVGLASAALSICDETVPANRNVDGIPSYAQCTESNDTAIYSNNGVDTSATQVGPDWVRTQWSGGYQCTELAHRYFHFRWGVKWIPNGNAGQWCDTQPPANVGVVQTMAPVHGDLMVLAPGSCGAAQGTGHVTVVDEVNDTKLVVVEQNGARRGNYNLSCGKCYLHVVANDGVPKAASGTGAAGAAAPATAPPVDGAAGGGATSGASRRPRNPNAAGSAAPTAPAPIASAGRAAPPASNPVVAPMAPAPVSKPTVSIPPTSLAAGSGAAVPLASAVTTANASPVGAAEDGSCTVAAVGSKRSHNMPLAFAAVLFGGVVLRRRRKLQA